MQAAPARQQDTTYTTLQDVRAFTLREGLIWGTTDKLVFRIDPRTEKLHFYNAAALGLPGRDIRFLSQIVTDDLGRIWVKEEYKAWWPLVADMLGYERPGDSIPPRKDWTHAAEWAQLAPANTIFYTLPLNDRQAWLATNAGLYLVDRKQKKVLESYFTEQAVPSLSQDKNGTIWIAAGYKGLHRLGPEGPEQYPLASDTLEHPDYLSWVLADEQGSIWLNRRGLYRLALSSGKERKISPANQLHHKQALWLHATGDTIWAGAANSVGIAYISNGQWHNFPGSQHPELGERINEMAWDTKGHPWISLRTNEGGYHPELVHFDGSHWERYRLRLPPYGSEEEASNLSIDQQGRVWFVRKQKLYYYLPKADTVMQASLPADFAPQNSPVLVDTEGAIWLSSSTVKSYGGFGTYHTVQEAVGIMRILRGDTSRYHLEDHDAYNDYFMELFSGADQRIYGIQHDALYRFEGDTFKRYFDFPEGSHITTLGVDPYGHIWAGTYEDGLLYIANGKARTLDPTNSVLPALQITDITFDKQGNVWVASYEGVSYINNPGKKP